MRFLTPAALRGLGSGALEDLPGRTDALVAAGDGDVRGLASAALLSSDYAVLDREAVVHIDTPEAWSAAGWRLGRKAFVMQVRGQTCLRAAEAVEAGVCDEVIEGDAQTWFDGWMRDRSSMALDSAAMLIRMRGGDALERAEFARLFAAGEPQKGLRAFLEKRRPQF